MSWLIESYITETKEANKAPEHDHPKSVNMKDRYDYIAKTKREEDQRHAGGLYADLNKNDKADQRVHDFHSNLRLGLSPRNPKDIEAYDKVSRKYGSGTTADAIVRHDRRHPDRKNSGIFFRYSRNNAVIMRDRLKCLSLFYVQ
jgi:hypothetical protein